MYVGYMECFMNKKKVLFIVSSLNFGGAQKVISNITTSLPEEYDIDILLNSDSDIQYDYRGRLISLGFGEPKSREAIWYQFKVFCKRLVVIRKLKKSNHYDSVVSILTSANVANVLCKTKDCNSIVTEVYMPNENPTFKEKYLIGGLTSLFYKKADCIVAETNAIADNLSVNYNIPRKLICVIPNSISVRTINEMASRSLTGRDKTIFDKKTAVVTAGRMQFQKAHWHLIRAFSKVVKSVPDAKLIIFGEGELKGMLSELIRGYHLEHNVFLEGFTNELDKYIANSRVFVFPSMFEGMPTALLQALAVGTPCITTDFYSGAREVLGDENTPKEHIKEVVYTKWGIMTPVCSGKYLDVNAPLEKEEQYLAEEIEKMLKDDALREKYRVAAKKRSMEFDNSVVIKKWISVI